MRINCFGQTFDTLLVRDDGDAVIVMSSNVRFPPGHLPPGVWPTLQEMNKNLQGCYFLPHPGNRKAFFEIRTHIPLTDLNPQTFEVALDYMAPRLAALDEALLKRGYGR